MNSSSDSLLSVLGLKKTKTRVAVLNILKENKEPLTVSDIEEELQKNHWKVHQVTIYRILEILVAKNLLTKITSPRTNTMMYELSNSDHHHFTCDRCGKMQEIMDCTLTPFIKKISETKRLLIKAHTLEFFGLCPQCQQI